MSSESPRRRNYARENVTFFVEEMVVYVLRRSGIGLELRRRTLQMEQMRAIALHSFTPSIGDAVIYITRQRRIRIMEEVNPIWEYIRALNRSLRGEVLQSSVIIMGLRLMNQGGDEILFILMSVVTQLCMIFCRNNHPALIGYAVAGLEYVFNHSRGGFPRIMIMLTTQALRMRILHPSIAN